MSERKFHDPDADLEIDIAEENNKVETNTEPKQGLTHPSYEELEAQLNTAEAKANENWDKFLRLQAEMDNQIRRHENDLAKAHKFANESVFRALLDVADNLERSLAQKVEGDNTALLTGVELTLKQLQSVFDKFSVKPINPVDEPFDPGMHEAMTMQEDAERKPGTVAAVLQKGYQLHDRLLRPALVAVVKAPQN